MRGASHMSHIQEMLQTHPIESQLDEDLLQACIDACFDCAAVCVICADACLAEEHVKELRECIRTNLDCADICHATGRVLARQTHPSLNLLVSQLTACATACQVCGDICEQHADMHEHCRVCAESCRHCEEACNRLFQSLPQARA
jgi:hypothetical protein